MNNKVLLTASLIAVFVVGTFGASSVAFAQYMGNVGSGGETGSYTLEEAADVAVSVYDSNGLEIRRLYPGWQDAGEYDVAWDGRDNSGEVVEDGIYTFEVTAKDEAGNYVDANTYISGEVTGVTYQYGIPYLMIGDLLIGTNNTIIEVTKTEPEDTTTVAEGTERYRPRVRRHELITNNE